MQKILIFIGIAVLLAGLAWPWLSNLPLGRLPGDIVVDGEKFRFYFPLTTMVLVSLVVSALAWWFRS
ncbi:MAG: DUF2905 domain-containing protein [Gammaproteobacteria bacterium]|nr:DUF2905 domain-containing protein [Pseudomonadales bacterium]MCP5347732.1 DUF2905 domain-containing protein [Pseudomonadales bacterium]